MAGWAVSTAKAAVFSSTSNAGYSDMKVLSPADREEIDRFCDGLWLEDGLSAATLASYRSDLSQFGRWLSAAAPDCQLLTVSESQLQGFIATLAQGTRASSQARCASGSMPPSGRSRR